MSVVKYTNGWPDGDLVAFRAKRKAEMDQAYKKKYHVEYDRGLRLIAKVLGMERNDYDLRHNMGSPGVIGEIILHTRNIYVCIGSTVSENPAYFMYRFCNNRNDRIGGKNRYLLMTDLSDPEKILTAFDNAIIDGE